MMRLTLIARALTWADRLWVLSLKELLQFSRDQPLVIFYLYAFLASIYVAGQGVGMDLQNGSLTVIDNDHSASSRELIHRFRPPYFKLDGEAPSARDAGALLDRARTAMILDIPPQFDRSLREGRPTDVQFQVDTTNSALGYLAASYAARIVGQFSQDVALQRLSGAGATVDSVPSVEDRQRVWFNPNQDNRRFQSLEAICRMVTLFSMLLPAAAMARERERGTIEQLLVSPLSTTQILLSKTLPMVVLVVTGAALSVLLIIEGALGVHTRGSLALYLSLTGLFGFAMSGMGLLFATLARTIAQVGLMCILVLAPMMMLSGSVTPPEAMPGYIRPLMYASPLYHFLNITFGILLHGAGLSEMLRPAGAIALIGGAFLGCAAIRCRKSLR